jgi:hypothetical protein
VPWPVLGLVDFLSLGQDNFVQGGIIPIMLEFIMLVVVAVNLRMDQFTETI